MKSNNLIFILVLLSFCIASGCNEELEMRAAVPESIFPNEQPDALNDALVIFGDPNSGSLPGSLNPELINITVAVPSAVITNDNFLFLPFAFDAVDDLAGIYLQVDGAQNYWDAPIEIPDAETSSFAIAIGIPSHVEEGDFKVAYKIYDDEGNVSDRRSIEVSIIASEDQCANDGQITIEGDDGITVRSFDMGDTPGTVEIFYYMYTQKDRMDIRYDNKWVASTSPNLLLDGEAPPYKRCDEATANEGFVSGGGTLFIDYDPSISRELNIYLSGCLEGGTLWYFNLHCLGEPAPPGETLLCGNPTAQLTYDPSHEDYHYYPETPGDLTTVICDPQTDPNCTLSAVYEALLAQSNFIAPTEDKSPVQDCKVTWVNVITPLNPILSTINAQNYAVTNYTLADEIGDWDLPWTHTLHPGKVTRSIRLLNGKIVISTTGEGTGNLGTINNLLASGLWGRVDQRFKSYWEQQ